MRVDLTEQFRGYISEREIRGESTWTASKFLKSSTDNLSDLISLNGKLAELDRSTCLARQIFAVALDSINNSRKT